MVAVELVGVPFSTGCRPETSYAMDQENGPTAIRSAVTTLTRGFDISLSFSDGGDISKGATVPELLKSVEDRTVDLVKNNKIPFYLGGGHTFTLGSLRGLKKLGREYSLIYVDCHPDVMPHSDINYGSGIYYALEEGVVDPKRAAIVGVRQVEAPEYEVMDSRGIFYLNSLAFEAKPAREITADIMKRFPPPYYLSIDLDVLSPHEAPGVGNPYPGGLTAREVLYLAASLCEKEVLGVEVVQLSPQMDRNQETASIAATLVMELSNRIARR